MNAKPLLVAALAFAGLASLAPTAAAACVGELECVTAHLYPDYYVYCVEVNVDGVVDHHNALCQYSFLCAHPEVWCPGEHLPEFEIERLR